MIAWVRRHMAVKLLLLIFLVGVVPYAAILAYTLVSEEKLYTERFYDEQQGRMAQVAADVEHHIAQLYRELHFLAGSVVMDDLLINDLDRRVASLLERYKAVYDLDFSLLALGLDGRVIASTEVMQTGKPYARYRAFESAVGHTSPYQADEKTLLLDVPVRAAMGSDRIIGYLVMEYRTANLQRFNLEGPSASTLLFNPETQYSIGGALPPFTVEGQTGTVESKRSVWFYRALAPQLSGWYVGYHMDRALQRSLIDDLNRLLTLLLLFGVGMIAAAAFWFSRRIVAPLGALQRQASDMVRTGQYSLPVDSGRTDEIGQLAQAFNAMAGDIRQAFEALERENVFRLQRLTQMIALFHRLMETEEESACLKTALTELKTLAPEYNVRFARAGASKAMPTLFVYDFEHETLKYYGSLILPEGLAEEEQAFFRAVASMIAARIGQIRAYNRLRRDSAAKTAFISHLSHDLRTPLHAILSQTQFLVGYGQLEAGALERIGGIEHAAQQLLGMVNDLLDLARLDAGKYEPELETLQTAEIAEMFDEVGALLAPLAEQKGVTLLLPESVPDTTVVADRRFLRQIILNLLSNAVKFTDSGSITCGFDTAESVLCLRVEDTGRGMTAETLKHVFEPFVQSEKRDRARGGSGLGLALSRRYAQHIGAELTLASDGVGRGSTARLCLTTL
ncbi:ATP-binding protein [Sulfurimonas sp. HSL-1656]|uniref:ATP-binding protein n=1 Tax=Thiomicrolovo subterrani TaxID=3131934 RepID=UPI0031F933AE